MTGVEEVKQARNVSHLSRRQRNELNETAMPFIGLESMSSIGNHVLFAIKASHAFQ